MEILWQDIRYALRTLVKGSTVSCSSRFPLRRPNGWSD
jgi:hypothetical protein